MGEKISTDRTAAKLSIAAAAMLDELGLDCRAVGLDDLAHFVGVAALQAQQDSVRFGHVADPRPDGNDTHDGADHRIPAIAATG